MKTLFIVSRLLILLLLSVCFNLNAAQEVSFAVTPLKNKLRHDSALSKNAQLFTGKGSVKVGIYNRKPHKRIGHICCHDKTWTKEYFLVGDGGDDLILQIKNNTNMKVGGSTASVYSKDGKLLANAHLSTSLKDHHVAISPSGKYFLISARNKLTAYDHKLNKIGVYNHSSIDIDFKFTALSDSGRSILTIADDALLYIDVHKNTKSEIKGCQINKNRQHQGSFFAIEDDRFFLISGKDTACVIEEGLVRTFPINVDRDLLTVYATDERLFILTTESIDVHSTKNLSRLGVFQLKPYYDNQYGKSASETPFFVQHAFDYKNKTFFLSLGGNTGTFLEVKIDNI